MVQRGNLILTVMFSSLEAESFAVIVINVKRDSVAALAPGEVGQVPGVDAIVGLEVGVCKINQSKFKLDSSFFFSLSLYTLNWHSWTHGELLVKTSLCDSLLGQAQLNSNMNGLPIVTLACSSKKKPLLGRYIIRSPSTSRCECVWRFSNKICSSKKWTTITFSFFCCLIFKENTNTIQPNDRGEDKKRCLQSW